MRRSDVENVLLEIGIPAGIKGFKYVTDAIMIMNERPVDGITKDLYPAIAAENNTIPSRVERAIRHAFEIARSPKGNYDAVEHYIGFMNCQNANSLNMLYTRIKQEEKEIRESPEKHEGETGSWEMREEDIRRIVRAELKAIMGGIA